MSDSEEWLQNQIENGATGENDDPNHKTYQAVFRALKKDPGYELPPQFALNVLAKIEAKRTSGFSPAFFWLVVGIFLLIVAFSAAVFFTGFKMDWGFLKGMGNYKGLVIFGFFFIALLNWLDKKLIQPDKSVFTS